MRHPAPSFLSQACSGHNVLAAASSAHSRLFVPTRKGARLRMIQFPVCIASISTIHRFIDVFNVFLFGSDSRGQKWRSMQCQRARVSANVSDEAAATFCSGGRGSREPRIGLGAFEFRSSVFKFPQASFSQFPQHPEKHRTTNPPIKC